MYAIYLYEKHTLTMIIMQQMACASRLPEKISKTDGNSYSMKKAQTTNLSKLTADEIVNLALPEKCFFIKYLYNACLFTTLYIWSR